MNIQFNIDCRNGNIQAVKKNMNNSNVDINWENNMHIITAINENQLEIIKLLLNNPKIKTDYENHKQVTCMRVSNHKTVVMIYNPFAEAMVQQAYDILDIFIHYGNINIFRIEYLNILLQMDDEKMNTFFMKLPGFKNFIMENDIKYLSLFSKEINDLINDVFLF